MLGMAKVGHPKAGAWGPASTGATRELSPRWSLAAELLHVPLDVRREIDGSVENDAYTALRVRLAWEAR